MDYYEILGVSRSATQTEIRNAYRKLAKIYHPDKNPSNEAKQMIQLINEAYDVLSDPNKKLAYDQPVFTYETVVEDPLVAHRREFIRKKREEERQRAREFEEYKARVYNRYRVSAAIIIAFIGLLLTIDNYFPSMEYNETILTGQTITHRSRRGGNDVVCHVRSETFAMAVEQEFYESVEVGDSVTIRTSSIFKIPKSIKLHFDDQKHEIIRTIYSIPIPLHVLALISGLLIYRIRYPNYATGMLIAFQIISILGLGFRYLTWVGDSRIF